MPLIHTEAITLRRRRTRDADALVILFGKTSGKVTASTKSVMKTKSRFAGVSQPFNRLHAVLYAKREDQDIWTLTQASLLETYDKLQQELNRLAYASCLAEWVDFLSNEFQSSQRVWDTLVHAFARWNQEEPNQEELFFYQWKLLVAAGLQPNITRCMHTGQESAPQWVFQPKDGGIATADTHEGYTVQGGAIQALRKIAHSPKPPTLTLNTQQKKEITTLLKLHMEFHAGLKSRAGMFLDTWMNQQGRTKQG